MKKFLLGTTAAVFLAAPAQAANLPVKAPPATPVEAAVYNWTGLYIGANGGWARGDVHWHWLSAPTFPEDRRIDGGVFGGHLGYQMQFGRFVLGAEVNALATRMDVSAVCNVNAGFRCESDVDRVWTVGPRGGVAFNNVLVYGTGGAAWTRIETAAVTVATGTTFWTSQERHNGWFAGGGAEYGFTPNFIVGVEATHVRLRTRLHVPMTAAGVLVFGDRRDIDGRFTMIRGRLTYKFGSWGSPVVARY